MYNICFYLIIPIITAVIIALDTGFIYICTSEKYNNRITTNTTLILVLVSSMHITYSVLYKTFSPLISLHTLLPLSILVIYNAMSMAYVIKGRI